MGIFGLRIFQRKVIIQMILQPKDTTVAYRCPECGATVFSVVGALALSGDMIKLKCTCGHSELIMQKTEEDKLRLTVPCIFCPSPHHYIVSRKLLLTRELFTFPCAYAGVDILFIGSKGAVMKTIELSDEELTELWNELIAINNEYNSYNVRDEIKVRVPAPQETIGGVTMSFMSFYGFTEEDRVRLFEYYHEYWQKYGDQLTQ